MPFIFKLYAFWFLTKSVTCSCLPEINKDGFDNGKQKYQIIKSGQFPAIINESSGLIANADSSLWTLNDSGGLSELYKVDFYGKLLETKPINAQNIDWEAITKDKKGTIYIGDFGNNSHSRQNLTIIKSQGSNIEKITFNYGNQTAFPPDKNAKNFDCEAFFWFNEKLYLFSKNWSKTDKSVKLYELPDRGGNYTVFPKDSIFIKTQVTGAAVNAIGTEFALITYGKLFIFGIENNEINFKKPLFCVKFSKKQTEAITYINDRDLMISNEQRELFLLKRK